ncbi:MAG TPA: hypothetical protein PKC69_05960 [Chitinophagaceae bacterium]|nr:hypothetical protein [Chitinophagaceae bacterium]
MNRPTHNNKRLIWESKSKQIWVILISFLFVAVAIYTKGRVSSFMFWGIIVFFGGGGLFILIRILNPDNLFVTYDTELGRQILTDQFQNAQTDKGFFDYTETGFNLKQHKGVVHYDWRDIETIFGFKEDRLTTDEVCMEIFFNDKTCIRLTESTPGWYQFNKRLSLTISTVPENWDAEITHPAFATAMTLLFDKSNRSRERAEKECYGD